MKLKESQLCVIQQALGLREMVLVNTMARYDVGESKLLLRETKRLRQDVIEAIQELRNSQANSGDDEFYTLEINGEKVSK